MLKIGIAGMGFIGRTHYEAARLVPEVRVVAAASVRRDEIRASYPDLELVAYEDLYRDRRLDAILICLPTYLHEAHAIDALARGRHVLCEKPLALTAESAARIIAAARPAEVVFMVSQVLRFWPQYVRMRELVKDGALGKIRSANAYRLAKYPPWGAWFRDPAKSGGCLLDLQVHDMDFLHWTLGQPRSLHSYGIRSRQGAWDHVITSLLYEGAVAQIESSYLMPEAWPLSAGLRIVGSEGVVEYTFRSAGDVRENTEWEEKLTLFRNSGDSEQIRIDRQDVFAAQLRHFAACVENPSAPRLCEPKDSLAVMRLLDASRRSAEFGQAVRIDPV